MLLLPSLSGSSQVCAYCVQFADSDFASQFLTEAHPSGFEAVHHKDFVDHVGLSSEKMKSASTGGAEEEDHTEHKALDIIVKEMAKNERIANFEEIKVNTEIMLGVL
jgi:hypothetical protein